jgi:Zn-finger nucleic acid-binding protein
MPRCPLCRSALVTITSDLQPLVMCASCGARWVQDGHQQRAIHQVEEPSLTPPGGSQPDSHARSQRSGQLLHGGSPWVTPRHPPAPLRRNSDHS